MKTEAFCLATLVVLAACVAPAARAQTGGNPGNWCRNGAFTDGAAEFRTAAVAGARGERVYFFGDEGDCPEGAAGRCRRKSYLIPGDEVIVTRGYGRFVCAWYQPPGRGAETVGWLPADRLVVREPARDAPPSAWLGEWGFYDNSISIRGGRRADSLTVEGQAYWRGLGDNIHVGEVSGEAAPRRGEVAIEEYDCRVRLVLVGDYLAADDNGQCGGANVTFDGVYRRKPARRPRR